MHSLYTAYTRVAELGIKLLGGRRVTGPCALNASSIYQAPIPPITPLTPLTPETSETGNPVEAGNENEYIC